MNKQFSIESLFEGSNYITVYDKKTGEPKGRIYADGEKYVALIIATGKEFVCESIEQAELFIQNKKVFRAIEIKEPENENQLNLF
jgi:hypothetical protein